MTTQTREPLTFEVIHPLNDAVEVKHNPDNLGPIALSRSVRFSLLTLRAYLMVMGVLVAYRMTALSGLLGHGRVH